MHQIIWEDPIVDLELEPPRQYITWYDLKLHTTTGKNQIKLIHQAFMTWFQKVRKANNQAIIYPWKDNNINEDQSEIPQPSPHPLSALKNTYTNCSPKQQMGITVYRS